MANENTVDKLYFNTAPGEDTLRILIATDNHLGFMENDPIRSEDSFRTVEEILQLARDCKVDMVLFGGDLFHQNRPSRNTLTKTIALFRKYCLGERGVDLLVRGKFEGAERPNFEDEYLAIDLPVFMIHGNHDDPTRGGVMQKPLSVLHQLAASGLVNYFGCTDTPDNKVIEPILIEKGTAKLKLYGLGWLRDERMYRMFEQEKIKFCRDIVSTGNDVGSNADDDDDGRRDADDGSEWLNIFMVHQNRDHKGRGAKNCFKESMIPEFMDLVLFGHEHECLIEPIESVDRPGCMLSQPGSSIVTSLIEGESKTKHVGVLELFLDEEEKTPKFLMKNIALQTVRPFLVDELALSECEDLEGLESEEDQMKQIETILTTRMDMLLSDYKREYRLRQGDDRAKPMAPLVRLRVEYTGFIPINTQRFGSKYENKVANPKDILQFFKRRKVTGTGDTAAKGNGDLDNILDAVAEEVDEDSAKERIPELVEKLLARKEAELKFVSKTDLNHAIHDFVEKEEPKLIELYLDQVLEAEQSKLVDDPNLRNDSSQVDLEGEIESNAKKREYQALKKKTQAQTDRLLLPSDGNRSNDVAADDDDDNDEDEIPARSKVKKKATSQRGKNARSSSSSSKAKGKRKKQLSDDDDDDDQEEEEEEEKFMVSDSEEDRSSKKKKNSRKKLSSSSTSSTSGRKRGNRNDDDEQEMEEPVVVPKKRPARRSRAKKVQSYEESDNDEEEQDGEDDIIEEVSPPPSKAKKGRSQTRKTVSSSDEEDVPRISTKRRKRR